MATSLPAVGPAGRSCTAAVARVRGRQALSLAARRLTTTPQASGGVVESIPPSLHSTAEEGPQPETLFRPDAGRLQGGEGEGSPAAERGAGTELPFPSIPAPDYEAERPQEQTPPEPDNPLPELPPNHPDEARVVPKGPEPEVPLPRRDEQDLPITPPDIVPTGFPQEAPFRSPPVEVPSAAPPEFSPGVPTELPDRGGSEINIPGH